VTVSSLLGKVFLDPMNPIHQARPRLTIVAAAMLALLAAGCGERWGETTTGSTVLQVSVPSGATPALLADVRSVSGVIAVAPMAFATLTARAGADDVPLTVAVTEPADLTPIASTLTDDPATLARGLGAGWLMLPAEQRSRLGVDAGAMLRIRDAAGAEHSLRVGALGLSLSAPEADGVIARSRAAWLKAPSTLLLVGVSPAADPSGTAAALAARLRHGVAVAAPAPSFLQGAVASRLFGSFSYIINGDGTITQDPVWVRRNIVSKRVPILGTVRCHRLLFPQLVRALRQIEREGLGRLIDLADFRAGGGCYVPRQMLWNPHLPLSMHAWGLAIDFNVSRNPYGSRPTQDPRIVAAFDRWGFAWGGRWATPDGMHFELASLLRRS